MGHIPEDDQNDDFLNASAEEWSKPSQPSQRPQPAAEPSDRWGSPTSSKESSNDPQRWGSPAQPNTFAGDAAPTKKSVTKWWIIVLVLVLILCLCLCVILVGLPYLGFNLFPTNLIPMNF